MASAATKGVASRSLNGTREIVADEVYKIVPELAGRGKNTAERSADEVSEAALVQFTSAVTKWVAIGTRDGTSKISADEVYRIVP